MIPVRFFQTDELTTRGKGSELRVCYRDTVKNYATLMRPFLLNERGIMQDFFFQNTKKLILSCCLNVLRILIQTINVSNVEKK